VVDDDGDGLSNEEAELGTDPQDADRTTTACSTAPRPTTATTPTATG
jgi:hypothetical protein